VPPVAAEPPVPPVAAEPPVPVAAPVAAVRPAPDPPRPPAPHHVVDEVAHAVIEVVQRNPGMSATVLVRHDRGAWSVWIANLDGGVRTTVTELDSGPVSAPPVIGAEAGPAAGSAGGGEPADDAEPPTSRRLADLLRRDPNLFRSSPRPAPGFFGDLGFPLGSEPHAES
jgi:hypothetical protein